MPLTAAQQLKVDTDLVNAVRKLNPDLVKSLINNGANPFAILTPIDTKQKPINVFLEIIKAKNAQILKIILEHARKIGKIVDLSEHILRGAKEDFNGTYPMNLMQICSFTGTENTIAVLEAHAEATGQKAKKLINEPLVYTDDMGVATYKTSFAAMLVKSLTVELIGANFQPTNLDADSVEYSKWFLASWMNRGTDDAALKLKGPFELTWKGPLKNLKALIALGLDVKHGAEGHDLETLIKLMCDYAKDPVQWAKYVAQGHIKFKNVEVTSAPELDTNGRVFFYATVKNKRGMHPVPFKITLDLDEELELVQKAVQSSPLEKRVGALENRVYKMSESLLEDARDELAGQPNALHCFNVLQREIEGYLLSNQIARSGRFALKATTQSAMIARNAQNILAGVAQISGFSSIALAVTEALVNEITTAYAKKQVGGVLNATEGMIFSKVATQLAVMLTNRAMASFAHITDSTISSLVSKVKTHFDDLHKFQNPAQLMLHAFEGATKVLPAPRHISDHSGSTPVSQSSGGKQDSGDALQWGYAALKNKGEEEKKSKSVFRFIPGYSCMHPKLIA